MLVTVGSFCSAKCILDYYGFMHSLLDSIVSLCATQWASISFVFSTGDGLECEDWLEAVERTFEQCSTVSNKTFIKKRAEWTMTTLISVLQEIKTQTRSQSIYTLHYTIQTIALILKLN